MFMEKKTIRILGLLRQHYNKGSAAGDKNTSNYGLYRLKIHFFSL